MDDIKPSYFDSLPKVTFTCTVCGKRFRAVDRGHPRKYCSMKCSQTVHIARSAAKNRAARKKAAKHK